MLKWPPRAQQIYVERNGVTKQTELQKAIGTEPSSISTNQTMHYIKRLIASFLRREPHRSNAEANIRVQQALRFIPRSWYDVRYQKPRKSK